MKRLIVCCDGTWDKLSDPYPTNVVKLARAFKLKDNDNNIQLVYYDEGIGSNSPLERLPGGAFGIGIDRDIRDAYTFICLNYAEGDEIFLFGFSRGAYTVRCLAQLINNYGVLTRPYIKLIPEIYWHYRFTKRKNVREIEKKNNPLYKKYKKFRGQERKFSKDSGIEFINKWQEDLLNGQYENEIINNDKGKIILDANINVLGCWDTVGQHGVPDVFGFLPFDIFFRIFSSKKYEFHNLKLGKKIKLALHAVSIDERRRFLRNTLMEIDGKSNSSTILKQFWFSGVHACVGGGNKKLFPMSNIALEWMINEFDPDNNYVDQNYLHEALNDSEIDPNINFLVDFPWISGLICLPKILTLNYLRPIPKDTQLSSNDNNSPNQFHQSVQTRYENNPLNYQNFAKNLQKFSCLLLANMTNANNTSS